VWSVYLCASACPVCPVCVLAPPGVFLPVNILRNGKVARERERAFALLAFFVDVDVGVLAPVLLL